MELRPLHSLDGLLKFAGLARSTFTINKRYCWQMTNTPG
ncbi:hypothetical protein CFBP3846_03365 [Pseudomonas syringae pv. avii]|uniref:Uncharacterized protein n=2 Tax=Pseudomonas syringae group TaxID=136849 RepID=A0ABY1U8I1_PSESX|nr:integrase catalytic subunit [Pseudomonas syringae pv. persicae]SOQ16593.1 integrase catalytic subunit [Pseudomonas syringae pv. persicae]SOS27749.1 hypothetical protein CFBP3846_03336 [Pseudomonas syringae pv. avii]SOS27774.1 hypothetical protein CFBP3846_03365 [Pseudomonas syringae pv. avii]